MWFICRQQNGLPGLVLRPRGLSGGKLYCPAWSSSLFQPQGSPYCWLLQAALGKFDEALARAEQGADGGVLAVGVPAVGGAAPAGALEVAAPTQFEQQLHGAEGKGGDEDLKPSAKGEGEREGDGGLKTSNACQSFTQVDG